MLTKDDLTAIQRMFDSSKNETNEKFINMDKKIDNISNRLQKNTEDLIELITTGFNAANYDLRFQKQDDILDDHETRIAHLES